MSYDPVQPATHSEACRRRLPQNDPNHLSNDRENCERCQALWDRLDATTTARRRQREARNGGTKQVGADLKAQLHAMGVTDRIRLLDWMAEHRTSALRTAVRDWSNTRKLAG